MARMSGLRCSDVPMCIASQIASWISRMVLDGDTAEGLPKFVSSATHRYI